jgi:hypothetical protein
MALSTFISGSMAATMTDMVKHLLREGFEKVAKTGNLTCSVDEVMNLLDSVEVCAPVLEPAQLWWTGKVDENNCHAICRAEGRMLQCPLKCTKGSNYCKKCSRQISAKGKLSFGTVEDRLACDPLTYPGAKPYDVYAKRHNITDEQITQAEKVYGSICPRSEKKRGRAKTSKRAVAADEIIIESDEEVELEQVTPQVTEQVTPQVTEQVTQALPISEYPENDESSGDEKKKRGRKPKKTNTEQDTEHDESSGDEKKKRGRKPKKTTEQVTEQVTPQVTEQVTPQVTEQVTPQVTDQLTPQVTEQLTPQVTEQLTPLQVTEQTTQAISEADESSGDEKKKRGKKPKSKTDNSASQVTDQESGDEKKKSKKEKKPKKEKTPAPEVEVEVIEWKHPITGAMYNITADNVLYTDEGDKVGTWDESKQEIIL